jgi:predicted Zn-dependent protease
VRYRFQVQPASLSPAQEVWFELVNPTDAQTIRRELQELDEALAAAPPPPPTLAELRAGLLASHGLLHDARLALAEEIVRHPDEPTLHFLLGDLYLRQGLPEEATESFTEAKALMSGAGSAR